LRAIAVVRGASFRLVPALVAVQALGQSPRRHNTRMKRSDEKRGAEQSGAARGA